MIFVGEHASITHSWIASALESGIRGSVQLLLGRLKTNAISPRSKPMLRRTSELGLVDEAKEVVDKWLARWIRVVSQSLPTPTAMRPTDTISEWVRH